MADTLVGLTPTSNAGHAGLYTEISGSFTTQQADIEWNNIVTTHRLSDNTFIVYAARFDNAGAKVAEFGEPEDVSKVITQNSSGFIFDKHVYGYSITPISYSLYPAGTERSITFTNANAGALTVTAGVGDTLSVPVVLTQNQSITLGYVPANATWYVLSLGGQAGWTTVSKSADQSVINSATLASALTFPMAASTKYRVRGKIFFDTTATGDFKYTFTGPASPTLIRTQISSAIPGAAPTLTAIGIVYPSAAGVAIVGTGTTGGYIDIDAVIHNGVNAGTFSFLFAQNTATNDTGAIVRAGSYIEYSIA